MSTQTGEQQKRWNSRGEASRLEVICITAICVMLIFLCSMGYKWYQADLQRGNDGLRLNTCETVARAISNNGTGCPVEHCPGGDLCTHHTDEGFVGYFDMKQNTIVAEPVSGYNEYTTMNVNGTKYYGDKGTMILKVVTGNGNVTISWVKGKD